MVAKKPVGYLAFIDEAGDDGIHRVRSVDDIGATEWFVLGAIVTPQEDQEALYKGYHDVRRQCGIRTPSRPLHFNEMNHKARIRICEGIASLNVRTFWVVSHKTNMRSYINPRLGAVKGYNYFYNWLARLLLERISAHCYRHSLAKYKEPRLVRCEFSSRAAGMKPELRRYLSKLRGQSQRKELYIDAGDITWPVIDDAELDFVNGNDAPGLQFADTAASALYRALPERKGRAGNDKFLEILRPRAASNLHGDVFGFGLKMMPKYEEAELTPSQRRVFESFGAPIISPANPRQF